MIYRFYLIAATTGVALEAPAGPVENIRMLRCQIVLIVALPAGPFRGGSRVAFRTNVVCTAMAGGESVVMTARGPSPGGGVMAARALPVIMVGGFIAVVTGDAVRCPCRLVVKAHIRPGARIVAG